MKIIKYAVSAALIATLGIALLLSMASTSATPALSGSSEQRSASVVLVHVVFKEGAWSLGPDAVKVLPCLPPRESVLAGEANPLLQVVGADGEITHSENMALDPRIILPEDDTGKPYFLSEVEFYLRLPLIEGADRLEFFEDPATLKEEGAAPSLSVDLSEAIKRYEDAGGPAEQAPCQEPEYKPDQRKK